MTEKTMRKTNYLAQKDQSVFTDLDDKGNLRTYLNLGCEWIDPSLWELLWNMMNDESDDIYSFDLEFNITRDLVEFLVERHKLIGYDDSKPRVYLTKKPAFDALKSELLKSLELLNAVEFVNQEESD